MEQRRIFFTAPFFCQSKVKLSQKLQTALRLNTTGGPPSFSTSAAVCLIQYGTAGPWRQTSVHQHAEDDFSHLGRFIIQAYDSVEVQSLPLISEAFSPLSSPPFRHILDVTCWMCVVFMLQLCFSTHHLLKRSRTSSAPDLFPCPSRATEQQKGHRGTNS